LKILRRNGEGINGSWIIVFVITQGTWGIMRESLNEPMENPLESKKMRLFWIDRVVDRFDIE